MKNTILSLLCAVALANFGVITASQNGRTCNTESSEAQRICMSTNNSNLVVHRYCNMFYKCSNGKPYPYKCPSVLLYDPVKEVCDWPNLVECGDRPISNSVDDNTEDADCIDDNDNRPGNDVTTLPPATDNENDNNGEDNNSVGGGNCDPSQAPSICAADGSSGVLVAHENCNQFYKCSEGVPVAFYCPPNLLFDPHIDRCEWAASVDCDERIIPDDNGSEDNESSINDNENNNNENDGNAIGGGNCDPSQAPSICADPESEDVLVAHENCNQFYQCSSGKPVARDCPNNLLFNPNIDQCDWPENVDCGDRLIPDPDDGDSGDNENVENDSSGNDNGENDNGGNDNNGTCNCNPGEAPNICAGTDSDGILIAHENCNQFYKCDHGKPAVFSCPSNTVYNPYKEKCDWPENVDCGDRLIPDPDDSDSGNNESGENDSSGNDNGENDNGGNDNNGTCNCNPGEASNICAGTDSDGILIAHENCNQFYKCDHGKPAVFSCPSNTVYNPYKEKCDWPENVDCGDRLIPDPDDSDSGNNESGENDSSGNDNGENDNGGNDNNGTCNCNPGEASNICAGTDSDGILIAHENCNQFYKCDHGKPAVFSCPSNTVYNPYKEKCDWPENVDCGDRLIPDPDDSDSGNNESGENDSSGNDNGENDNGGNDNNGTCNCNPGEASNICAGTDSDGILIAHENCNQFYKCDHGKPAVFSCPSNTVYNPYKEKCDWPENVDCGDRLIPDPDDSDSGNNESGENDSSGSDNGENDNGGNDNNGTCNCNPGEAPNICAGTDSDGILIAHENCNQFYKCDHGKPAVFSCPSNTVYNPYKEQCDWPENVDCGDRLIPDPDDSDSDNNESGENDSSGSDNGENDNGGNDNNGTCNCNPGEASNICAGTDSDGILIAHENCNQFYKCDHGKPAVFSCPSNTVYNPYKEKCDWPENVDCGDRLIPDPDDSDSGNNESGENDSSGNDNGENDNGGNDNNATCNCNPGEASNICAGTDSDGILIAHENCNQFYKCDHGKPTVFSCPSNTVYNPYKEKCDWPENVDCGDRLIPDPDDSDSGNNESGENDSSGNDNVENDNDGNDNNGTCNCNPGEAPNICAGTDSDGILIAHENCNQFYKCDHGKPAVFSCPSNTVYNPYKEKCDWPENVDCGDRLIPDPDDSDSGNNESGENDSSGNDNGENDNGGNDNNGTCNCNPGEASNICAGTDSDGILIAHENCNQFYKCDHGKPAVFSCPSNTVYNPYKEKCDWPENVDCGDRLIPDPDDSDSANNESGENDSSGNDNGENDNGGNDNNGTCNCNPGEASNICAGTDSDGILIAHENCNQFYKCDHGKPAVFSCPSNTVYNPYKEKCDWPENVDCGDRLIPDLDDSNSGATDNDSTGNDNSGIDNDNNESDIDNDSNDSDCDDNENGNDEACNCNPEEAPSICAGDNSNGILIAHENCNQFYQCSNGNAEAFTCPGTLLYNPLGEKCDWPYRVDCGDRIIPEPNSKEDSSSDSDDLIANDPEDIGSCNCDPNDAPTICAVDNSDGVLIAHENCNKFYKCSGGVTVAFKCPGNTLYNPFKEYCDWPSNVKCGERVISDSEEDIGIDDNNSQDSDGEDDSNNTINDDPSQAPAICAVDGSESTLVAHENCNQFYQCSGGVPKVMSCAAELLFNPVTQTCDWPHDVDCGDRIIPETDDDCACNPRNAPELCSRENSNGKLIAHENCHQFYMCDAGVPVTRNCPWSLVYNIELEVCDWPQNVKCDNRFVVSYSSVNKHFVSRQTLRK